MPVTAAQRAILSLLATNRGSDSFVAGSVPMLFAAGSGRVSTDIVVFNDSTERLSRAYESDSARLRANGYDVRAVIEAQSFRRAEVRNAHELTVIDWAADSPYRFLPAQAMPGVGYVLHPVDHAINKVLALAGRFEPRDYLDVLYLHDSILPLAALCWAAPGKDPGFSPRSLLELLKRQGRYRPEQFAALTLTAPVDVQQLKSRWLAAVDAAEAQLDLLPRDEAGCLYYSVNQGRFTWPVPDRGDVAPLWGCAGGSLPNAYAGDPALDALRRAVTGHSP